MPDAPATRPSSYDVVYRDFDSALMRRVREEAYGEDIGQHSWVGAEELRGDWPRLGLSSSSRLLDLGAGPCGPLTFLLANIRCRGTAVDQSAAALEVGRARAESLGVGNLLSVEPTDLDQGLPFSPNTFDAAVALDVVLHLADRTRLFREVARVLRPRGRFLFTDAGVLTGPISADQIARRSRFGGTWFVPPGWNESALASAGFRLLEAADRTASLVTAATGRLAAIRSHRAELESVWGAPQYASQADYLEVVLELARHGSTARMMFLAELA